MLGAEIENNVEDMDPAATAAKMQQYPNLIVGIKTAHFSRPGWAAVERAVEAGRLSGKPVIIDNNILSWTGRDTRTKVLEKMRPGDIHTHTYNDRHLEIVDRASGKLQPFMVEARRRGVLFDLGHGAGSFLWPVAEAAAKQGFMPDTISTDLHASSIMGPQSDMPNCISKMMLLGMTLGEAIRRSTVRPAEILRRFPELGTLGEGRTADVAVFKLERGVFGFKDAWLMKRLGTQRLVNVLTVKEGKIVFDLDGLSFPEWQNAGDYQRIP
jgi:dihydroorotase